MKQLAAPQTAQAPVTRKSTEARNSFKHVADDESVYTAAKYSKMPQCFAYIRGVWGFIDKKSRQYICAKEDTVSTDQTPAMKPKPNAFTALEHPIPNLGITSLKSEKSKLPEDRFGPSHGSPLRKNSGQRCVNSACSRFQRRSFSSLASSLPREVNSKWYSSA